MFKFGAPPLALERFGVSGLLKTDSEVYHESLFGTRHIGRVSDLLCARLQKQGLDSLRMRSILIFSAFASTRAKLLDDTASAAGLQSPLILECGVDDEKIGIGFRFEASEGFVANAAELAKKLEGLRSQADGVVVRYSEKDKAVEIVGLLGIPGKLKTTLEERAANFAFVIVDPSVATARPLAYVEAGDLDHKNLLADPPQGGTTEKRAPEKKTVVAGKPEEDNRDSIIFSANKRIQELEEHVTKLEEEGRRKGKSAKRKQKSFWKSLWPFGSEAASGEEDLEEGENAADATSGTAAEKDLEKSIEEDLALEEALLAEADAESEKVHETPLQLLETVTTVKPEVEADALVKDIASGEFSKKLNQAQLDLKEVKEDIKGDRARKWVDGFMSELLAEKARIQEMAKKVSASIRQKEHEFKTAEKRLMEEVRMRDELLKQRGSALARVKDQLAKAITNAENARSEVASEKEEAQYRQKYAMSQKLLAKVKQENTVLNSKTDELKAQFMRSRAVPAELNALKAKFEKVAKQMEDLRKQNQQLQEKANQAPESTPTVAASSPAHGTPAASLKKNAASPASHGANAEEFKKKLDAANRVTAQVQAQAEQLQLRIEELEREESRLKKELLSAQKAAQSQKKTA